MRIIYILLMTFLIASPASAAFKSASDAVSLDQLWNPGPMRDDVVLPMPCGLHLALRAINIPDGALLRDRTFNMGIANTPDDDRQIYEKPFSGHIASPFLYNDLPAKWRQAVAANSGNAKSSSWYFLGKYEISQQQWNAVMNALDENGDENKSMCPKIGNQQGSLPITGISWFEAQNFLNKYNAWLMKNHVESLPHQGKGGNIAFFRLPTEEEWEYGARGISHVPPEWWADHDIFPFAEGKELKDYAVMGGEDSRNAPLPIGSRMANPFGLFDTAGNAKEMIDGYFRMSVADMSNGQVFRRLHGASGGLLTKGGSFRSEASQVMPGARDELPLFTAAGPGRQNDLGLRLVLAGLNIPDAQRMANLRKEAAHIPKEAEAQEKTLTPIERIDKMSANLDGNLKKALDQLKADLEDERNAREAEDRKNLEQSFRSLLYQAETLRAFAFRYNSALEQVEKVKKILNENMTREIRNNAQQVLAQGEKDLKDYMQTLIMGANYYKTTLASIYQKDPEDLDRLFAQARQEYNSGAIFDEHMRKNIKELKKFMEIAQKRGISALNSKNILKGLISPRIFPSLEL